LVIGPASGVSTALADASWPAGSGPCAIPCGTLTDQNIKDLMSLMTIPEEDTLAHLGGTNVNGNAGSVPPVARLAIPVWHWTDGPAGVRLGAQETAMPAPVGLTASWDPEMARLFGHTVGLDARATIQDGWYAPMMNQVTIPTGGRNFETLGEDPFLMSQMAAPEVQGAQGVGFVTEIKHYVENDFENGRMQTSVYVDERTLHEGEMQAFDASVQAGARALMCAYNRLNIFVTPPTPGQGDIYSCSNDYTLNQVLKGRPPFAYTQQPVPPAFGFKGNVGSDYGATHRITDLIYGLDTEQPGQGNLGNPVITAIGTCSAGNAPPCSGPGTAAVAATADFPAQPVYTADQWKAALDNAAFYALKMYNDAGYLEGTPYGSMHVDTCVPANLAGGASAGCAAVTPPRSTVADLDTTSRAAAQTIAERSAVLLKDDAGFFPLQCSDFTGAGVLVTGPTAFAPYTGGGGSAHVTPKPNAQSPYDALVAAATAKCGGNPVVNATPGYLPSTNVDGWPVPTHGGSASDPGGHPGLLRTQASSGTVVPPGTAITPCTPGSGCAAPQDDQVVNYTNYNNAVLAPGTGWVWQGSVTAPPTDGPWVLRVCYANQVASATNGAIQLFASATPFSGGIPQTTDRVANVTGNYADQSGAAQTGQCHSPGGAFQNVSATGAGTGIASGETRYVELRAVANGTSPLRLRFVWAPTTGATFQTEAIADLTAMAAPAKKVLDFVYDDGTEGSDRGNNAIANGLALNANQNAAASAAIAANAMIGVVLNTGDSVFMPWAGSVKALLEMWYPGQLGGAATADVLLGNVDPGGKLPETFYDGGAPVGQRFPQDTQPAACEDNTANYGNSAGLVATPTTQGDCPMYPGIYLPNNLSDGVSGNRHGFRTINFSNQVLGGVQGNGIFTGYRWFDENGYTPLFPFGHGLSYTTFAYSHLNVTPTLGPTTVSFDVTNSGPVAGDEVPQVYVGSPASPPVPMAVQALAGFQRISLDPGQTKHVTIEVAPRAFQYWSVIDHKWVTAFGDRSFAVGSSSRDIRLSTTGGCLHGTVTGPLTVNSGQQVCAAPGARLTGPVTVKAGASFDAEGATITGPFTATGADVVRLCGSTFTGPVKITGSTSRVVVGGDDGTGPCAGNTITGAVTITGNTAGVVFDGNRVTGPVTITGNTGTLPPPLSGTVHATGNTITGPAKIQSP
jgi:beta-glucosidase